MPIQYTWLNQYKNKSLCRLIFIICFAVGLSACKVDLYSGLDEKQGNEMLSLLLMEGIDAEKAVGKGNTITLKVDENQLSNAIEILSRNSYPRTSFATLDDVFPPGGLISTPTEESARYNYAVSQDLASTISNIDGVLTARVHLVLPAESKDKKKKKTKVQIAKASVFIKHSNRVSLDAFIPQIKLMVANAVTGLKYENIAVVVFPTLAAYTPISRSSADENLGQVQSMGNTLSHYKNLGPWIFASILLIIIGLKFELIAKKIKDIIDKKREKK